MRFQNVSQAKAAALFTNLGFSSQYGTSLEKKFKIADIKSKAIFTDPSDPLHKPNNLPMMIVNKLYLHRGYNPLYFSRDNILRIREIKQGLHLPHNKQAYDQSNSDLNSS